MSHMALRVLAAEGKKRCRDCGGEKPLSEFRDHITSHRLSSGKAAEYKSKESYCIKCCRVRNKSSILKIHGTFSAYARKRRYGLSQKDFDNIVMLQGNACAVCENMFKPNQKMHVDHNHETGKVRGITCHRCNLFIGYMEKSPGLHEKALRHLGGGRNVRAV